ncbi:MAG TPA: hypothetical protein VHV32_19305 [Candidatus Angelobacter sp.]|jgi:hypothetical protein|nr:hypothetical protein [Candidatus Angelobacter sp.]
MPSQLQPPYLNTPLSQVVSLDAGFVLTVVNALAAGGSGTANSQIFTVPEEFGTGGSTLTLTAVPNGGVTTVTVDIEVSTDGGTTWQKKHVGVALIASSVSTQAAEPNLQSGMLYRINPTTVTGGTSVTINATAN